MMAADLKALDTAELAHILGDRVTQIEYFREEVRQMVAELEERLGDAPGREVVSARAANTAPTPAPARRPRATRAAAAEAAVPLSGEELRRRAS